MELAKRKDVPVEETWDLSLIYPTEEAYLADVERVKALAGDICEKFQGKLTDADAIVRCLDEYEEFEILSGLVGNYAGLAVEVDYTDGAALERDRRNQSMFAELYSRLTFIRSEILQQPETVIEEAVEKSVKAKNYLRDILRAKPHTLSPGDRARAGGVLPELRHALRDLQHRQAGGHAVPALHGERQRISAGLLAF